jgi:hypothetical protein
MLMQTMVCEGLPHGRLGDGVGSISGPLVDVGSKTSRVDIIQMLEERVEALKTTNEILRSELEPKFIGRGRKASVETMIQNTYNESMAGRFGGC